jgi:N-acetylneuraminic acid mutarotase
MLAYDGRAYLFGGTTTMYGQAKGPGDLTVLGSMNDLWRYDMDGEDWMRLEDHDGRVGFTPSDPRPCTRMLTAWHPVGHRLYLFGGITILGAGWKAAKLNDTWSYDPNTGGWELIEPDDGRDMETSTHADAERPGRLGAMGSAVIGERIYLMGGFGGPASKVVMSAELWCYDVAARKWEHLGPESERQDHWPPKRYCPVMVSWHGKLCLWGGRDTVDQAPQFYNDLWEYDPGNGAWTCLQETRPDDAGRPSPRYGLGHGVIGDHLYLFGGFGGEVGNDPQLNDLWRIDLASGQWECLYPHNSAKDYSGGAERPGVRRVPGMTSAGGSVYLFGGLDLASGPKGDGPLIAYNDFWRGTPA